MLKWHRLAPVVLAFLLPLNRSAFSQVQAPPPLRADSQLTPAQLSRDLTILREAFETLHPGLYRYNTPQQIDTAFAALSAQLRNGATLRDTFLALSAFTASLKCGHTYLNVTNQSQPVVSALFSGVNRVPFYFRWIDGHIIVTRDGTPNHVLPPGTQVLSINGIETSAMLRRLLPLTRADGANDAKRIALLDVTGSSTAEAFDIFAPLVNPQITSILHLQVRSPSGALRTLSIPALSSLDRSTALSTTPSGTAPSGTPLKDQPAFTRETLPGNLLLLRMPSWALFNSKWDWHTWLDRTFDDAIQADVRGVILDLRGNEGGQDDIGQAILARLPSSAASPPPPSLRLVKFRSAPAGLVPFLNTWDKGFLTLGAAAAPIHQAIPNLPPGEWFDLNADKTPTPSQPAATAPKLFRRPLIVLVDAQNSSATFQFAQTIQTRHLGRLLGEPTGGNRRGINGGAFFFLHLPGSGLEIDLPLIGYFPTLALPDGGLTPDLLVPTTPSDIANGTDPQLTAAKQLLQ